MGLLMDILKNAANEILIFWYCVMCTYIVLTNPAAHEEFLVMNAGVFGLYKWLQERENAKANSAIRSNTL